jgi:hypothetical protein
MSGLCCNCRAHNLEFFTGGQGDKMAYRAIWIRFRGADGGIGRDNKQEGKQNAREVKQAKQTREMRETSTDGRVKDTQQDRFD